MILIFSGLGVKMSADALTGFGALSVVIAGHLAGMTIDAGIRAQGRASGEREAGEGVVVVGEVIAQGGYFAEIEAGVIVGFARRNVHGRSIYAFTLLVTKILTIYC